MSYVLSKPGVQIDAILNRAQANGAIDQAINASKTRIVTFTSASAGLWDIIESSYTAGKTVILKRQYALSGTAYYDYYYLVDYSSNASTQTYSFEFMMSDGNTVKTLTLVNAAGSYSWVEASKPIPDEITVDSALSDISENPVQNKVIKGALDSLEESLQDAIDEEVERATNAEQELDSQISGIEESLIDTKTVTGTQITVEDAAPLNAKKVLLTLKPHQDLHGYDHPWPAGGGKNKFNINDFFGIVGFGVTWYKFTHSDSSISKNGNMIEITRSNINDGFGIHLGALSAGTYTLSFTQSNYSRFKIMKHPTYGVFTNASVVGYNMASTTGNVTNWINSGNSVTFDSDGTGYYWLMLYTPSESWASDIIGNIQLEAGSTASDWTPYSNLCPIEGHTEVSITRRNGNLLPPLTTEIAESGMYFTPLGDDSVRVHGVRSGVLSRYISGEWESDGNTVYVCSAPVLTGITWYVYNQTASAAIGSTVSDINGFAFSAPKGNKIQLCIRIEANRACDFTFIPCFAKSPNVVPKPRQLIVENICINQWDEEWELGDYYNDGTPHISSSNIRTKNYIPVKTNTTYYFKAPNTVRVYWYDDSKTVINTGGSSAQNGTLTSPEGAAYCRFYVVSDYGTTYNNDISINYPASFTDYFPYTGNGVAYSGTIDLGTGKMVLDSQFYQYDGSENWNLVSNNQYYSLNAYQPFARTTTSGKSSHFQYGPINTTTPTIVAGINSSSGRYVLVGKTIMDATLGISDVTGWKNWLASQYSAGTPLQVWYELKEPITIQLTPQQLQMLKGLNTIQTDADDMELAYCYVKDGKSVVVSNAEQLLSKEMVNDQEPYLFRASGGNGADREYDTLVGGTVCWNQPIENLMATGGNYGLTWTNTDDKTLRLVGTPTTTAFSIVRTYKRTQVGHKLMITGGKENAGVRGGQSLSYAYCDTGTGIIIEAVVETATMLAVQFPTPYPTIDVTLEPRCYDLTEMFGSTIADYAYTLDQANKGAGVAWLKKYGFFTKPYYPYNAGELMSVKTTRHKMVGFNQFDITTMLANATYQDGYYVGKYSTSPRLSFDCPDIINLKQQICVRITAKQTGAGGGTPLFRINYTDGTRTSVQFGTTTSDTTITALSTAGKEISFFDVTYGSNPNSTSVMIKDVCINLHKPTGTPKNGDYLPYVSQEYDLGSDELRGLFKLDANNNIVADGDIKTADGIITRKYRLVDLGSINYVYDSTNAYFYTTAITRKYGANIVCLSDMYSDLGDKSGAEMASVANLSMASNNNNVTIKFKNTSYSDPAVFKTAMSGVYIVAELNTPYFEPADPFEELQALDPYGTEEYVDDREVPIPVGHDTNYPVNLRAEIERVMKEVPPPPTSNGTYILKVTVASGVPTYSWVAQ